MLNFRVRVHREVKSAREQDVLLVAYSLLEEVDEEQCEAVAESSRVGMARNSHITASCDRDTYLDLTPILLANF